MRHTGLIGGKAMMRTGGAALPILPLQQPETAFRSSPVSRPGLISTLPALISPGLVILPVLSIKPDSCQPMVPAMSAC